MPTSTAEEIFKYYKDKLNPETKYNYPAKTKMHIDLLLKSKYTKEDLIKSIDVYKAVKSTSFTKSPLYFFYAKTGGKDYMFFETYLQDEFDDILCKNKEGEISYKEVETFDPLNGYF